MSDEYLPFSWQQVSENDQLECEDGLEGAVQAFKQAASVKILIAKSQCLIRKSKLVVEKIVLNNHIFSDSDMHVLERGKIILERQDSVRIEELADNEIISSFYYGYICSQVLNEEDSLRYFSNEDITILLPNVLLILLFDKKRAYGYGYLSCENQSGQNQLIFQFVRNFM